LFVLQISSTAAANPLDVEDYLDCFEEMSSLLLEYVVNMTDMSVSVTLYCSERNFVVVYYFIVVCSFYVVYNTRWFKYDRDKL
jgi:hypothetical protein